MDSSLYNKNGDKYNNRNYGVIIVDNMSIEDVVLQRITNNRNKMKTINRKYLLIK